MFCLERWQSERETAARYLLSESGVAPLRLGELEELVGGLGLGGVELGYGWTRGSPGLREGIAGLYRGAAGPEGVVATAGSAEANLLAVLTLVEPGDTVVVDMPNYMQVWGLLRLRGARVVEAWRSPRDGWRLPVARLVELVEALRPRAVFVTNPNNPTGAAAGEKELAELAETAERAGAVLVFDEVYRGLEHGGASTPSILEVAGPGRAVSVSGLSKAYGLPGLRLGWLAADRGTAERAWAVKDYTSIAVPRLSDHIASRLLNTPGAVEALLGRARRIVSENLAALRGALERPRNRGLLEPWWPEAGAFLLARLPWARRGDVAAEELYRVEGVLTVPGECFMLEEASLRIGLGLPPSVFRGALEALLRGLRRIRGGAEGERG